MDDIDCLELPGQCFALPAAADLGIVVARYGESLDPWEAVAPNVYLYDKKNTPQSDDDLAHSQFRSYEVLPNVGREGQTYCHHVYNNYDNLEPIIIFSQADPFDLIAPATNTTQQMVEKAMGEPDEYYPMTIYNEALIHDLAQWEKIDWSSPNESYWITANQIKTLTEAPYDMAEFWRRMFDGEHPPAVRVSHGATFAVRREGIKSQDKSFYKKCLDEFEVAGENAVNPEVGFFMERTWLAAFSTVFWLPMVFIP